MHTHKHYRCGKVSLLVVDSCILAAASAYLLLRLLLSRRTSTTTPHPPPPAPTPTPTCSAATGKNGVGILYGLGVEGF